MIVTAFESARPVISRYNAFIVAQVFEPALDMTCTSSVDSSADSVRILTAGETSLR